MKGVILVAALLSGFYILTMNILMTQIKAMENFYSNADQYANNAVQNKSNTATIPQPLQTMMQPYGK